MEHRKRIKQAKEHEYESMSGFLYFMLAVPFICLGGIASAMYYASKIDHIPNWLILTSITSLLAIFGVIWLVKRVTGRI